MIVPTLPRGNALRDALRRPCAVLKSRAWLGTRSVPGGIPTRSVGTIEGAALFAACGVQHFAVTVQAISQ